MRSLELRHPTHLTPTRRGYLVFLDKSERNGRTLCPTSCCAASIGENRQRDSPLSISKSSALQKMGRCPPVREISRWTPEEEKTLIEGVCNNVSIAIIARDFNRSLGSVKRKLLVLQKMGRCPLGLKVPRWTSEEEEKLIEGAHNKVPLTTIAKDLNRSLGSVKQKRLVLQKMGRRPIYHKLSKWTPEEEEKLIKGVRNNVPLATIAKSLNRSFYSVRGKLIGLRKTGRDFER